MPSRHRGGMRRLDGARERLDGTLPSPDVLAGNFRDLRWINRLLGGVGLSARAIDALIAEANLASGAPVALLDVGTGGADIPIALIKAGRRRGRPRTVLGIDSREEVLAIARASANAARVPELLLRR